REGRSELSHCRYSACVCELASQMSQFDLRMVSSRGVEDRAPQKYRVASGIAFDAPTRSQPANLTVGKGDAILRRIITVGLQRVFDAMSYSSTVVRVQRAHESRNVELLPFCNAEHQACSSCGPNRVVGNIPRPHAQPGGGAGEIHAPL